ncbi:hypothetical protein N7468_004560 [Penicillium chermesinum]|uniref:Probable E3 ubiquitin ligase complex SCF subunit sconB n=1 Tax=Penicillium chermesinum TaxID=63820 RepID=A0A9W9P8I8_9EURO|nr:uncharacterized protein N7468_004560 [Penicillium chermesinum]KAJ5239941.1 hypothetical protein N7468_004560 [Penicillium chermesinum]
MSPEDQLGSTRRRPSLSLRPRPRTAAYPFHVTKEHIVDQWREPSQVEAPYDSGLLGVAVEEKETEPFPEAMPRRRSSKSFSTLRHPMDGLVALGRRLSFTIRSKSSRNNLRVPGDEDDESHNYHLSGHFHLKRHTASGNYEGRTRGWLNGHSINRRPSLNSVSALQSFYAPTASIPTPIPGHGQEPPILPNHKGAGAAARAAAAAQNERMELAKLELARAERERFLDSKLPQDSESGIGIDLRDRSDLSKEELGLIRIDPASYLPAEITAHILSYLDPSSLMNCECVSRSWQKQASSPHVWKHVFHGAHPRRPASSTTTKKKQFLGLGKETLHQDWKRMYLVRQALEQRWKEGKAAAIYLHGHKDSVYCAQFDESVESLPLIVGLALLTVLDRHKIITGSRDRTIRVWDAHYPWPCLKVIGPPPGELPGIGQVNNPTQQASGKSPFLTICPPSTPLEDIMTPMEQPSKYHSASILCLRFDEEIMVTGSSDHTCIVWDIKRDYRPICRLSGHSAGVLDVCFDDRYIVSCSKDSTICVWDRKTGALLKQLLGHLGPVNAVQLRGDLVVSASGDGVARLWNVISGQCVKEFPSKDRGLACVEFSDDGRTILTGGNDRTIYQFDANTGELVNELKGHSGLIRSLHLDSMNKRIVSGSYDMSVKVFDTESGELSLDLPGWTTSWMLNVQSDYRRILATSQDSRAVIMDFGYGLDGIDLLES